MEILIDLITMFLFAVLCGVGIKTGEIIFDKIIDIIKNP